MSAWIIIAFAIPVVVTAIERILLLRFLSNVYKRGGSKDLKSAASATRHLAPRRSDPKTITKATGGRTPALAERGGDPE